MAAAVSCQAQAPRLKPVECRSKNSGLVAPWFDVTGLDGPLGRVADACGWSTRGSGTPDPRSVRKLFVEGDNEHAVDFMRPHLEKRSCLQVTDSIRAADTILRFSVGPVLVVDANDFGQEISYCFLFGSASTGTGGSGGV